jgi:hypothetical protein
MMMTSNSVMSFCGIGRAVALGDFIVRRPARRDDLAAPVVGVVALSPVL